MGSIEVYDSKQGRWVPYVPDFKKWEQHFRDISEGRVRPDHKGRYIVGSGSKDRISSANPANQEVKVELVTPVAHAVEMAKSELKREMLKRKSMGTLEPASSRKQIKAGGSKRRRMDQVFKDK